MKIKYYLKKLIRQGLTFQLIYKDLGKSENFSRIQIQELQNKKLKKLVKHCYKNVPYYKELFDNLNLKPSDIQTIEDLKKLPLMDKHTVRKNQEKLIAKNRLFTLCNIASTSGTTGTPLKLHRDYKSINFENAIYKRFCKKTQNLKKITLRGQLIVPITKQTPPFWEYNPADKELLMSSYHLSKKTAGLYIEKIKGFNPEAIFAYPSSVSLLAQYFKEKGEKLNLKAVFTSSEKLEDYQRNLIEETFNCKVFDWYGQAERVAAIGQCKNGNYHIIEDYSIVETIKTEQGLEIVGTSLENYLMPLLRYKTGDIVELEDGKCSCKSEFRKVKKIIGRETNYYFMTQDGLKITTFDHFTRGVEGIIESQVVQEKIGELVINLVTSDSFDEKAKNTLIKNIKEHTTPDMVVIINEMAQIPRGANGKFKSVINKFTEAKYAK